MRVLDMELAMVESDNLRKNARAKRREMAKKHKPLRAPKKVVTSEMQKTTLAITCCDLAGIPLSCSAIDELLDCPTEKLLAIKDILAMEV